MLLRRHRNGDKRKSQAGRYEGHEVEAQPQTQGAADTRQTEGQENQEKSLSDYTVPELKAQAKDKGHTGYSTMDKGELVKLLGGE